MIFNGLPQPSTTGSMRVAPGWVLAGRNNGDVADRSVLAWDGTANGIVTVGDGTASVASLNAISTRLLVQNVERLNMSSSVARFEVPTVTFGATVSSPTIAQQTKSGAGDTMTMSAQSSSTLGGGSLVLEAGDGTAAGQVGGDVLVRGGLGNVAENGVALHALPSSWNGGLRTVFIASTPSPPSGNPVSGGYLWVDGGGNLVYRGPAGTITTIAPA